jgi:hypothetical protein
MIVHDATGVDGTPKILSPTEESRALSAHPRGRIVPEEVRIPVKSSGRFDEDP